MKPTESQNSVAVIREWSRWSQWGWEAQRTGLSCWQWGQWPRQPGCQISCKDNSRVVKSDTGTWTRYSWWLTTNHFTFHSVWKPKIATYTFKFYLRKKGGANRMMCWILIFEGKKSSGVEGRCNLEENQHQMKGLKGFVVSQNTNGYVITSDGNNVWWGSDCVPLLILSPYLATHSHLLVLCHSADLGDPISQTVMSHPRPHTPKVSRGHELQINRWLPNPFSVIKKEQWPSQSLIPDFWLTHSLINSLPVFPVLTWLQGRQDGIARWQSGPPW